MDQLKDYIQTCKKAGLTDIDIKSNLMLAGWPEADIQKALGISNHQLQPKVTPAAQPALPTQLQVKKRRKSVFSLVFIALIVFILAVTAYLVWSHTQNQNNATDVNMTTASPSPSIMPLLYNLAAFVKFADISTMVNDEPQPATEFVLYDLGQNKIHPATDFGLDIKPAMIYLGPWSINGRYLPLLIFQGPDKENPLYLFDIQTQKINLILKIQDYPELSDKITDFAAFSRWKDENNLIFTLSYNFQTNNEEFISVDTQGKVSKSTRPRKYIYGNKHLDIWNLESSTSGSLITEKIFIDNHLSAIKSANKVLGQMADEMVIWENLIPSSATGEAKLATSSAKLTNSSNLSTSSILHFYSIIDGQLKSSVNLDYPEWLIVDMQIRAKNKTIIALQKSTETSSSMWRFVKITPQNPSTVEVIAQIESIPLVDDLMENENAFGIINDDWLVSYQQSQQPEKYPQGKTIMAWKIDGGQDLILCQDRCDNLRIFNPNHMQLK